MSRYIREGGRSFHECKGRYINPYEPGSTQFNDFERGWSQALKRSPEQLLRDYRVAERTIRRPKTILPNLIPRRKKTEMPEDTYLMLAMRATDKLLNDPSYQPPKYGWSTKVYYVRIEAYEMPLWKIGVTSNNIASRYCLADGVTP